LFDPPSGLQSLRSERELAESEITSLFLEKKAIQKVSSSLISLSIYLSHTFLVTHLSLLSQIIPKILHELMLMKEGIDAKQKEINIYDKAIAEIEASYEHILYSEEFYVDDQNY
jgi:hypothetical protein